MTAPNPAPAGVLTLVVPMPPLVTNASGRSRHWRREWSDRREYFVLLDSIAAMCRVAGAGWCGYVVPPCPAVPLPRVTLTSHMTLRGAMDDDNAAARHKALCDWLVRRGYLASDRRTCVRWVAFPTQHVTRKQPASITLTITPTTLSHDTP